MSHLGARAAAVVDGELGHAARDRALAHIAHCAQCRLEVEAQRRLKSRLANLGPTTPPADLTGRLLRMPPSHPPSGSRRPPRRSRRPSGRRLAGAGGGLLVVAISTAIAAGGQRDTAPPVDPTATSYLVEHAANSSEARIATVVGAAAVSTGR